MKLISCLFDQVTAETLPIPEEKFVLHNPALSFLFLVTGSLNLRSLFSFSVKETEFFLNSTFAVYLVSPHDLLYDEMWKISKLSFFKNIFLGVGGGW